MPCSLVVQLARVGVRVILVDVVCVMLVVLIAHVDVVHAVNTQFSFPFSVVGDVLFTDVKLLLRIRVWPTRSPLCNEL